jgi:hypothetical protein
MNKVFILSSEVCLRSGTVIEKEIVRKVDGMVVVLAHLSAKAKQEAKPRVEERTL